MAFSFSLQTSKKEEFLDLTRKIQDLTEKSGVQNGLVVVYVPHTTCGITINENADPDVPADILMALKRAVPDNLPYSHAEGNSPAHIKASLMGSSKSVFIETTASNSAPGREYFCANLMDRACASYGLR